ncbi:DUF4230 domain-containing protein [Aquimarina intermedia]|uniref:Uncharacterized protein DUF4230 n=1 Tax=Aquimarina intermedia TaxID=350814 RepID=A0A5S5CFV2_9FLAO|nr:DUF4230 domain-containing protein [Aquimarina intermedia]TYP77392.1 uncharacterized protein DUF4230 [Aquimarina intermedia]
MRNFILGSIAAFILVVTFLYFFNQIQSNSQTLEASQLIADQIKNTGKLVVNEGHFSEVITYKNAKKFYLDILTIEKKAVVVVNAKVSISYDLRQINHSIDQDTKTIVLSAIPQPEIDINPTIKYHHLEEDFLNPFTSEDHNLIQKQVKKQLLASIKKSSMLQNSQNRLLSELNQIYILTNSLGWTLKYNNTPISNKNFNEAFEL